MNSLVIAALVAVSLAACGDDDGGGVIDAGGGDFTLSKISDQTIDEDMQTTALTFTVSVSGVTLTAESSDKKLVPDSNISIGGSGTGRTITVKPADDENGSATITITGRLGSKTSTTSFKVTVRPVNDAPTIGNIADKTTEEGVALPAIPFTIGDADTAATSLTVTATSDNTTLVPASGLVLAGSGTSRTLTVTPAATGVGSATITVKVSDGMADATDTFSVTVSRSNSVNDPPVNKVPAAQKGPENMAIVFSAANANEISVSDPDAGNSPIRVTLAAAGGIGTITLSGIAGLTFTAGDGTSDATMTFTGTIQAINTALNGMKVTPPNNFSGSGMLTITSNDQGNTGGGGAQQDVDTVQVSFEQVNDPPTVSAIPDKTLTEDAMTGPLAFIIGDAETPLADLVVTRDSSNPAVIPVANVVLGGTGANRTVAVTPAKDAFGSSIISIKVSDGQKSATMMFTVNVTPVEDNPTIADVPNQSMNAGQMNKVIDFTVGDAETAAASLTVTSAQSGSPVLTMTLGGTTAARTLTVSAPENMNGSVNITLTVTDGAGKTASDMFTMTVNNINDPPLITIPATTQLLHTDGGAAGTGVLAFTTANALTVADPDIGAANLELRLEASHGTTITDVLPSGVTRTAGADHSATQTLSGPIAKINEVLDGLLFESEPGFNSGSATLKLTADDGGATGTGGAQTDTKTVNIKVNAKPSITDITAKTVDEDNATAAIPFTINDFEQGTTGLTVTARSSNARLVPNTDANLTLGGTAGARTIKVTPKADASGTSTITVTVTDTDGGSRSDSFLLTVNAINDKPVVTMPSDAETTEDLELEFIGELFVDDVDDDVLDSVHIVATNGTFTLGSTVGLDFTVGDGDDDDVMTFSGSLDDINAALDGAFFLGDLDYNGDATLEVTASDGTLMATDSLPIDVIASNDAPVITTTDALTTLTTNTERTIKLSVADVDVGAAQKVEVTITVDKGTVAIPTTAGLTFTGATSGAMVKFQGTLANVNGSLNGTGMVLTPMTGFNGDATVTAAVSDLGNTGPDGVRVTTASWVTTYAAANTAPTISAISDRTIDEDSDGNTAMFTIGDGQTSPGNLNVTVAAVPNGADPVLVTLTLGGSGASRTITAVPAPDDHGKTTITITVSDGKLTSNEVYQLTVSAVNDEPIIDPDFIIVDEFDEDTSKDVSFDAFDPDGTVPTMAIHSDDVELLPNTSFTELSTTHVKITPVAEKSGIALVTLTASDGTKVATSEFLVFIDAVNDPPKLSGAYPTFTVADKEVGAGTYQITIDVTGGTLTLKTVAELTFVDGPDTGTDADGDGNQDAHMIFKGSQAAVNAAMNGMIDSVTNGTITIVASDLGVSPPTDTELEGTDTVCVAQGTGVCP